ncbi:MAG: hypothetical protein LQ350_004018 [Teloschistes chrysophthalmus]|nr:MAG: hypothetical protein LQ350_004018 [Niorma chrysophthalma]
MPRQRTERQGSRPRTIEELIQTSVWSGTSKHNGPVVCTICTNPYQANGERPIELWCGHVFGEECITNWLRRSNSCPHCRDMPLDMPSHLVESMEDNRILEENLADMERRVDELVQEDEEPERAMNETALEQHERARRTHISHPLDQTELQYREEEFDRLINVLQEEQQRLRQHMHQLDQYRSQLAERMEEEDRQREAERRRRAERRAERMEELDRLEEAENRRGANGWRWF